MYPNCKSVDEVSEWLEHKFLLLIYTERRFSHETGEAIEESKMHRIPLNSLSNTNYKFQLQVTHLKDLDPGFFPLQSGSHSDFYNIVRLPDQPLVDHLPPNQWTELNPNRFQVSFEVSPEQIEVHVLPAFTSIEIFSMLGGLVFAIFLVGSAIFNSVARFQLEGKLVSKLYYSFTGLLGDEDDGDIEKADFAAK
jgi:hypothetical protein